MKCRTCCWRGGDEGERSKGEGEGGSYDILVLKIFCFIF